MTIRDHALFWSLLSGALVGFLLIFQSILLPFVLAFAIAYLLDPFMARLNALGMRRGVAAFAILFVFFALVGVFFATLIPLAYRELVEFSNALPGLRERALGLITPYLTHFESLIGQSDEAAIKDFALQHLGTAADIGRGFAAHLVSGGQAFAGFMSVLVLTPLVAYFVMKDWNAITEWVFDLVPDKNKDTILDLLRQINAKVSGFVRGQITVAFILGVLYAIALSVAGLQYGVLVGLVAGALNIIPMLGSTVGLLIGLVLAWFQSGDWVFVATIGGIFVAGQILEGNFLTPKLVGDSVGMHPLWIFFALMAGGALFGLLGMMVAVPVVAVAGVLIAFAISQYKRSVYYLGAKAKKKSQPKSKPKRKRASKTNA